MEKYDRCCIEKSETKECVHLVDILDHQRTCTIIVSDIRVISIQKSNL